MKNFKRFMIAIVAIIMVGATADAQFRFGVKAGVNINKMSLDKSELGDELKNHTGYQFGVMTEFTAPLIGIGMDASLMYAHRKFAEGDGEGSNANYLDIPIHLKYKLGLPGVGKLITPFLFIGPDFAINFDAKDIQGVYKEKKFDTFLDLGVGVELVSHLQIAANYSWGLTKTFEYFGVGNEPANSAKINGWTISAAYLF